MNTNRNCGKCGVDLDEKREFHFSLKKELLYKVVKSGQKACIICIELVLGRKLTRNDFTNEKVNRTGFGEKSARLLNRLEKRK